LTIHESYPSPQYSSIVYQDILQSDEKLIPLSMVDLFDSLAPTARAWHNWPPALSLNQLLKPSMSPQIFNPAATNSKQGPHCSHQAVTQLKRKLH